MHFVTLLCGVARKHRFFCTWAGATRWASLKVCQRTHVLQTCQLADREPSTPRRCEVRNQAFFRQALPSSMT
jgi:hypothetical protein